MALNKEQQKLLEELTAKAQEPDAEDFEVEIYNEHGRGARLPISRATDWFRENFGIGAAKEESAPEQPGSDSEEPAPGKQGAYFGRAKK